MFSSPICPDLVRGAAQPPWARSRVSADPWPPWTRPPLHRPRLLHSAQLPAPLTFPAATELCAKGKKVF